MFKNSKSIMDEPQILSFVMWSVVTGIIMVVTGLSYRAYVRRNNHD